MIRTHKLGEADLIVVLLTREHGIIRAVAQGIRRSKSRFGARLDRFNRVNVQVYNRRKGGAESTGLGKITDAHTVRTYAPAIVAQPELYFAAAAMIEIAYVIEGETPEVFDSLDEHLARLAEYDDGDIPVNSVCDRFVLHVLRLTGWSPSLVDCAQCGKPGPHRAFHPEAGGAVCVACRLPGSLTPDPQAMRALWLLDHGRDATAAHVLSDPSVAQEAHGVLLNHVRYQLSHSCPAYSAL